MNKYYRICNKILFYGAIILFIFNIFSKHNYKNYCHLMFKLSFLFFLINYSITKSWFSIIYIVVITLFCCSNIYKNYKNKEHINLFYEIIKIAICFHVFIIWIKQLNISFLPKDKINRDKQNNN